MVEYINDNGKVITKDSWSISPDNRSFRYGDGCFETMKIINGKILLSDYHFERLFTSLGLLKFETPHSLTPANLSEQILELANKNGHQQHARVRLTCYRGDGGLYDSISTVPNYLVQTLQLSTNTGKFNEYGLAVDFFLDGSKSCDQFSSIKSNNFLPYTMGALWAKQHQLDDALILNSFGNVADASIANVFVVKDGSVHTPPLTDGAINGVMRRHLLKCLREEGIKAFESTLQQQDVLNASEVFLTNAISGIRWVKQVGNSNYSNQLSRFLHEKFVWPMFNIK